MTFHPHISHETRQAIQRELIAGKTIAEAKDATGVSQSAVARERQRLIEAGVVLPRTQVTRPRRPSPDVIRRLGRVHAMLVEAGEALEAVGAPRRASTEEQGLRAAVDAVAGAYDVCALYHGSDGHSATALIEQAFMMVEDALVDVLGVAPGSWSPYEGDGGLEEALRANVRAILVGARVISEWDCEIARHPEGRDAKIEAEFDAEQAERRRARATNGEVAGG